MLMVHGGGEGKGWYSDLGFHGCHAYKKDAKNDEAIDCCTQQFSRGFWRLHASKYAI